MRIIGKAAPDPDDLERAQDDGFDSVELYVTTNHLDAYETTVNAINASGLDVAAVHTPHVSPEQASYIDRAADLAGTYNALLVFHSSRFPPLDIQYGEELAYNRITYENQYGFPRRVIEHLILEEGKELTLDTAHLFIASDTFYTDMELLVERAAHIHLCDSTTTVDGLPFGEGNIDMERVVHIIQKSTFDGSVVMEVMPEHQQDAKLLTEQYLDD